VSTTGVKRAPSQVPAACVAGLALLFVSCSRDPDLDEVFAPPRLREPAAAARGVTQEFELTPGSQIELSFGSFQRTAQGRLDLVGGKLLVDPLDLAATRGSFSFDLLSVRVQQSPTERITSAHAQGEDLTEQSLRWLQVADPERLAEQPQLRYARFTILRIGGLSATRAAEGELMSSADGGDMSRRVRLRATGELELHTSRIPYTVALTATFNWPAAAPPGSPPASIEIATTDAVSVDLNAHGIVPRDARGDVLAETMAELRKPSASEARVTARWIARRTAVGATPEPR
jgi:hypothetical protein